MASIYRHTSRDGWNVQFCLPTGRRVVLWVGPVSKSGAKEIAEHCTRLIAANRANVPPPNDSARWSGGCCERIKTRLIEWGLVPASNVSNYTINQWVEQYCSIRTDVDESTRKKYRNARRHLLAVIADKDIRSVTVADADRFARSLTGEESTKGKIVKVVKQMFAAAVDDRLLETNPFNRLKGSTEINRTRSAYVDLTTYSLVFNRITSPECRLAFCLARLAGLRIPSEIMTLKPSSIDWEAKTILIDSPKGKRYAHRRTRLIPLFPEIESILLTASEGMPTGSTQLLNRFRNAKTLRTQLITAIRTANLDQWPKLWVNLRASFRTDLEAIYPVHVCDDWLGHSDAVAVKHYKRVTPDHFARAVNGAVTKSEQPEVTSNENSKNQNKPSKAT